jgi:hypothetical protein
MAYETKVILTSIAEMAVKVDSREMYNFVAKLANVEGVVLQSFDKAKEAQSEETKKQR